MAASSLSDSNVGKMASMQWHSSPGINVVEYRAGETIMQCPRKLIKRIFSREEYRRRNNRAKCRALGVGDMTY